MLIQKSKLTVLVIAAIPLIGFASVAEGQSFSSGSNGSDGALNLTGTASGSTVTFVPANFPGNQHSLGIFNFTTITIPTGVTVRLSSKNNSGPVVWLASGDVDIEGTVDLSGQAGIAATLLLDSRRRALDAGAGGFAGGVGGKNDGSSTSTSEPVAQPGDGPGGGAAAPYRSGCPWPGSGGTFSGDSLLVPLVGGSGGGGGLYGGALGSTPYGASGGAGGGAIFIASSTTITVGGTINVSGGAGGNSGGPQGFCQNGYAEGYGGGGSGGGIRLAANTLAGSGTLNAAGGAASSNCGGQCGSNPGGSGVVRIEAFTDSFTGKVVGTESSGSPYGTFVPTTPPPSISVTSVNSTAIPATPSGSLATPDVTINTSSSVTLTVQASYIPVGTIITLYIFSDNNSQQTIQTTPLSGALTSSTATATATFPSGYSLNYVKATWTSTN